MWVGGARSGRGGCDSGLGSPGAAAGEVRYKVRAAHAVALSEGGAAAVCARGRAGVLRASGPSGRVNRGTGAMGEPERQERRSRAGASRRFADTAGPGWVSRVRRRRRGETRRADFHPTPGSRELPAAPLPVLAPRPPPPPVGMQGLLSFPPLGLHARLLHLGSFLKFGDVFRNFSPTNAKA